MTQTSTTQTPSSPRWKTTLRHGGAGLLGAFFAFGGIMKLAGPGLVSVTAYGFPTWFAYLVGATELAAGLALFVPRFRALAGTVLVGIMLGAAASHVGAADWPQLAFTLVLAALNAVVVWTHLPAGLRAHFGLASASTPN